MAFSEWLPQTFCTLFGKAYVRIEFLAMPSAVTRNEKKNRIPSQQIDQRCSFFGGSADTKRVFEGIMVSHLGRSPNYIHPRPNDYADADNFLGA